MKGLVEWLKLIFLSKRNMKVIICEDPWASSFFKMDTGFGNRLIYWGTAYEIMLRLGREWRIGVRKDQYPELEHIRLPKTFIIEEDYKKSDIEKISLNKLINIFNYGYIPKKNIIDLKYDYNVPTDKLKYNIYKHFGKVTLKSRFLNYRLKKFTKDMVGIHIRRGHGVYTTFDDVYSIPKRYQKYYIPSVNPNFSPDKHGHWESRDDVNKAYKFVRDDMIFKQMDKFPKSTKFYISADLPQKAFNYYKTKYKDRIFFATDFLDYYNISLSKFDSGIDLEYHKKILSLFDKKETLNRTSINIIDYFSLAFCNLILCGGTSTFSIGASNIRGNEIKTFDESDKMLWNSYGV